jgi:MoaE-MoaD fusion protein
MLYFGIVRERLGRREETRDVPDGTTVGQLLSALEQSDGLFSLGAGSIRVAVNREYVEVTRALGDGDEVALIPPVAGGVAGRVACCVSSRVDPWSRRCS